MSHSFRKNPIFGYTTHESDKEDKRFANRSYRRLIKVAICSEKAFLPLIKAVSSPWDFAKDGKHYVKNPEKKWMRK